MIRIRISEPKNRITMPAPRYIDAALSKSYQEVRNDAILEDADNAIRSFRQVHEYFSEIPISARNCELVALLSTIMNIMLQSFVSRSDHEIS